MVVTSSVLIVIQSFNVIPRFLPVAYIFLKDFKVTCYDFKQYSHQKRPRPLCGLRSRSFLVWCSDANGDVDLWGERGFASGTHSVVRKIMGTLA